MLKKTAFLLIFAVTLLSLVIYNKKPSTEHALPEIPLVQLLPKKEDTPKSNPALIAFNARNDKIKSVNYSFTLHVNSFDLDCSLYYEKPRNLRMITNSFLGKECDIGSNNILFWFWSKRMKPAGLYYANHEAIHRTRLKTPFHPIWLMETLGIDKIEETTVQTANYKEFLVVFVDGKGLRGQPITRIFLIDPSKNAVKAIYTVNKNGFLIISMEVLNFQLVDGLYFPKVAVTNWPEENMKMYWTFGKPRVNLTATDEQNWIMPNSKNKINLDGY